MHAASLFRTAKAQHCRRPKNLREFHLDRAHRWSPTVETMNSHSPTAVTPEEDLVVLTADDVSIEQVGTGTRPVVSADQMEDESFQANGQNFQNN